MSRRSLYEEITRQIALSGLIAESLRRDCNFGQTQACLHSAWGTEALLLLTSDVFKEEEAIRLSNNWSAIQTYYVLYHCTHALHVAHGHSRPENHPKTQNVFHSQWAGRNGLLNPWTFGFGFTGAVNCPSGSSIDLNIHPWASCSGFNALSLYAKALMTTRREDLLKKYKDARERNKQALRRAWQQEEGRRLAEGKRPRKQPAIPLPRLTDNEKQRIDEATRSYTLIDYIYRLRIKTNYEDSNMFTDGPEDGYQSGTVRDALHNIASGTLFLYESAIKAIIGRARLLEWASSWAERNLPCDSIAGVAGRLDFHRGE